LSRISSCNIAGGIDIVKTTLTVFHVRGEGGPCFMREKRGGFVAVREKE